MTVPWHCRNDDCDWTGAFAPTETPRHYCPDCGRRTAADFEPEDLEGTETLSDKI